MSVALINGRVLREEGLVEGQCVLLSDGRIHPSRIEEVVARAKQTVQAEIKHSGEEALYEVGVQGPHPVLVRLMGCLRFRTSYGQNVLSHSKEVAGLCATMAAEIGCTPEEQAIAREAGLLHDLGKAVDHEVEVLADRLDPGIHREVAPPHADVDGAVLEDHE